MKEGLAAIVDQNSTRLILGTMPGDESLRLQQYYSHPRNHFWPILERVFAEPIDSQYAVRLDFLRRRKLALWDVLARAERAGSLDSAIAREVPNDLVAFLDQFPRIRSIAFNGRKARRFFDRYAMTSLTDRAESIEFVTLPSSSPTPGKNVLMLEEKVSHWRSFLTGKAESAASEEGARSVIDRAAAHQGPTEIPFDADGEVVERSRTLRPSTRASVDSSYRVSFKGLSPRGILRLTVRDADAHDHVVGVYEFRGRDLAGLSSIHFVADRSRGQWRLRFTPAQPFRASS